MRGVILAGGTGSRFGLTTKTINKHCLLVHDRPMILWSLKVLLDNGITDITIVSTPTGVGQLAAMLGSGKDYKCQFTYRVQDTPGGVAEALACAETESVESMAVILGDNIFLPRPDIIINSSPATCFLKNMAGSRLSEFGVAQFRNGNIIDRIVEKPTDPPSSYVATGLYIFQDEVFSIISSIKQSQRGEVEITDVLNYYAKLPVYGILNYKVIPPKHFWGDAGTIDGLRECSEACRLA